MRYAKCIDLDGRLVDQNRSGCRRMNEGNRIYRTRWWWGIAMAMVICSSSSSITGICTDNFFLVSFTIIKVFIYLSVYLSFTYSFGFTFCAHPPIRIIIFGTISVTQNVIIYHKFQYYLLTKYHTNCLWIVNMRRCERETQTKKVSTINRLGTKNLNKLNSIFIGRTNNPCNKNRI